ESPEPHAAPAKRLNAVEGAIYSEDDPDVTPAKLLTTREGGPLFRGMVPDMNTMEMVVSEQGRVEQVRLLTPAKRMTDVLLLSGAKTWKFAPAVRDGQPVRYRTMFSWPSIPGGSSRRGSFDPRDRLNQRGTEKLAVPRCIS